MPKTIHHQRGFSLLEILIAFSILALSLGILLNIFSGGLRRAMVADEYQQAVTIAQSLNDAAGIMWKLEAGEHQGEILEKYSWRINVQPMNVKQSDAIANGLQAYTVTITIEWFAGKKNRLFELNTLKLTRVS